MKSNASNAHRDQKFGIEVELKGCESFAMGLQSSDGVYLIDSVALSASKAPFAHSHEFIFIKQLNISKFTDLYP